MKTINYLNTILLIALFLGLNLNNSLAQGKMHKVYQKLEDRAVKLRKHGALAVVGVAVADAGRIDIGKTKAIAEAQRLISEIIRVKIESTLGIYKEQIGLGNSSKYADKFDNVIKTVSSNVIKGAIDEDFNYFRNKQNKKEGTSTYVILYYISPKTMYKSFENSLKAVDEENILYQQYRASELKKQHDKEIEEFEKMMNEE